jgi:hypothetical protein
MKFEKFEIPSQMRHSSRRSKNDRDELRSSG